MIRFSLSTIAACALLALGGCATSSSSTPKPTSAACNTSTGSRLPAGSGCSASGANHGQ
jgi:predicted outer membrane protein